MPGPQVPRAGTSPSALEQRLDRKSHPSGAGREPPSAADHPRRPNHPAPETRLDPATHICDERTIDYSTIKKRYITCVCGRRGVLNTKPHPDGRGTYSWWKATFWIPAKMPGVPRDREAFWRENGLPPEEETPSARRERRLQTLARIEKERRESLSETDYLFSQWQAKGGGQQRDGHLLKAHKAEPKAEEEPEAEICCEPGFTVHSVFHN